MDKLKTGTSTLGICYDGGVVVGADHRATMGHFIANKSVQKLFKIGPNLALTTAGLVGHAQSLSRTLNAETTLPRCYISFFIHALCSAKLQLC